MDYLAHKPDLETGDGRCLDALDCVFRVRWCYDYDTGYEAEAILHRAEIHNLHLTRDMLVEMCGAVEVIRAEREAAEGFATNWRDYVPEAAE